MSQWPGQKFVSSVWGGERLKSPPSSTDWPPPFWSWQCSPAENRVVRPQSLIFWWWKLMKHKRKHPSFSAWIYLSQWSQAYSIPVKFRIRFRRAAAAKNKKDSEIKEHLQSCFAKWKKRIEPCYLVLRRTMHGLKTCARRQQKQGPDRASERPHHSCQFEISRLDSFSLSLSPSLSLLEISFVLRVPKVYCS